MDFFQCISLSKAQELIADQLKEIPIQRERVQLLHSLGRIAAEDILSQENLPPFTRSTVDGFAVRSADTFGASESAPALFMIIGEVIMGKSGTIELKPGQAAVIPTGGMLPKGADAVVMLEYTEEHDGNILMVLKMVAPGENLVAKGDDIEKGTRIVKQGQKIGVQHIGALAACGWAEIPVVKRVNVAILSTGDELVPIYEVPENGQIRDVNSYALGAMLSESGCMVETMGIVKDSFQEFYNALVRALEKSQMVIISGGSSVGIRDYTEKAINALGTPGVLIHGIAMKPGKPTIFGMVAHTPIFGLPGHPVAAITVCHQLVKVAARFLGGQKEKADDFSLFASLGRSVPSAAGRDDFINVRLSKEGANYIATPLLGKSGLISTMSEADGTIHIPADKSGLYHGETIEVMLIKHGK